MNAKPSISTTRPCARFNGPRGFSLIEVLAVTAIIALVASIAVIAASRISEVARTEKLSTDVATLNAAIDIYAANGGDLDGLTTADEVLGKLKTTRTGAEGQRHTGGPSGRMVDPRIVAVDVPAGSSRSRAIYNPTEKRFDIATAGNGVEFDLDDALNEIAIPTEVRDHGAVAYSEEDSWVWDYTPISNPSSNFGPTTVNTAPDPGDSLPPGAGGGGGGGGEPPEEEDPPALATPTITPPGGYFPYDDFPISVTIAGAANPSEGTLMFKVDGGAWAPYAGETIIANVNTEIWAQNVALDPMTHSDSSTDYERYRLQTPPRLPTPKFTKYGGAYPFPEFPMMVELTNVPDPAIANPMYRLRPSGGSYGPWTPYTGPIGVPINTNLQARYFSTDTNYYRDSYTRSGYYYPIVNDLGGGVTGRFHDAEGGDSLVSDISGGGTYFSHGDPTLDLGGEIINAGEPNTLEFEASNFSDIEPGETFKLGELQYHNGTTFSDSHATGVMLEIVINLADPAETITIDLDFDLINTENSDDADASADYVRINNLTQDINLTIHGVEYSIQLEFGGTDSFGFSSDNQFHVYEGATGTGEINGTFVANP